jgi:hypothetical protein
MATCSLTTLSLQAAFQPNSGCYENKSIPYIGANRSANRFFATAVFGRFFPIESWGGGEKQKDVSISFPYPNYHPVVEEFFRLVSGQGWLNPEQAYQMLKDENVIKTASLSQIKIMLTFCVRGERFSDGHWAQMIEEGYIRRLLERLNEIKSEQIK